MLMDASSLVVESIPYAQRNEEMNVDVLKGYMSGVVVSYLSISFEQYKGFIYNEGSQVCTYETAIYIYDCSS